MNLKFCPRVIADVFHNCIVRFPISVGYITILTVFLLIGINQKDLFSERFLYVAYYYFSVGYMLSLSLHLWQEETASRRTVVVANVVAHAVLIADAIYLYRLPDSQPFLEKGIAHTAAVLALWLSMFFLSFLKEKDNMASWNFAMKLVAQFMLSHVIGLVMFGGLSLLMASFSHLFGVDVDGVCYENLAVLFCLYLPSLLFLGLIPGGEAKHDRSPMVSKFMNGVLHYLFLPLIGCYIVVLYVYALQILGAWKLPDGWVSWLVVALMTGCIGIEFGLYPVRKKNEKCFDGIIARWLPIVILPLLILMTVGIARRFHDYGITINRLYLATLNAWFYFVCAGLFITRAKRINWITISFSIVFLVTSALPVNYVSITRRTIYRSVAEELKVLGADKFPLNKEEYKTFMESIPEDRAEIISGRLEYMVDWFGHESVADIADKDIPFWNYKYGKGYDGYYADFSARLEDLAEIELPKGYSRMVHLSYETSDKFAKDNESVVLFVPNTKTSGVSDTIYLDIKRIKQIKQPYRKPVFMRCSSSGCVFMLTYYNMTYYRNSEWTNLTFSGYLFKK